MIDVHCHILDGMDDGARTLEESMKMAEEAVFEGIKTVVATPHHRTRRYENYRRDILTQVDNFNDVLQDAGIPLTVLPGQETRIYGEIVEGLEYQELLPVNVISGYVYIELPETKVSGYVKHVIRDMQTAGYIPVISRAEYNKVFQQEPDQLYELVKNGCLTQLTAASIVGKNGGKLRKFAHQLIEHNLAHFVASNAHHAGKGFYLQQAYQELSKTYGNQKVYSLMENSQRMVAGKVVVGDVPEKPVKKRFLRLFA